MVVHSGLVDSFTGDEDALAAVLFHEAVHGQLRHGSEKVSLSLLAFGAILFFVLEFGVFFFFYPGPGSINDLMIRLAVDLPFTKTQEVEADTIALRLLAQACYDPRASVELHNRARTYPRGPFPFLAKHRINASRMHNLREASKEAQAIYENSDCASQRRAFHSAMRYFPSSNQ